MKRNAGTFTEERLKRILELITERKRVTVRELCEHFNVSLVTIRNHLNELSSQGRIIRTHGGAMAVDDTVSALPFNIRRNTNFELKNAIAREAAGLVNNGEVIFIDGGTTAVNIPQFLRDKSDITVITPSIEVSHYLLTHTAFNVYMLNGYLNRKSYSAVGEPYEGFMSEWNIAKAFLGAAGLTIDEGLSDRHLGFVEQKRVIVRKAVTVIGLVDSSKLGILSLGSFAGIDEIDIVVTDRGITGEMQVSLEDRNIQVIAV